MDAFYDFSHFWTMDYWRHNMHRWAIGILGFLLVAALVLWWDIQAGKQQQAYDADHATRTSARRMEPLR